MIGCSLKAAQIFIHEGRGLLSFSIPKQFASTNHNTGSLMRIADMTIKHACELAVILDFECICKKVNINTTIYKMYIYYL